MSLIDCQQRTGHLASLGAREIPRSDFESHLARNVDEKAPAAWAFAPALWAGLDLGSPGGLPTPIETGRT